MLNFEKNKDFISPAKNTCAACDVDFAKSNTTTVISRYIVFRFDVRAHQVDAACNTPSFQQTMALRLW
jgi:hypothetical protein